MFVLKLMNERWTDGGKALIWYKNAIPWTSVMRKIEREITKNCATLIISIVVSHGAKQNIEITTRSFWSFG